MSAQTPAPLENASLWAAMKANRGLWIETTQAMHDEQLCCLPPERGGYGLFLVGEPTFVESGEYVFACFRKLYGLYFARYLTGAQFERLER